MSHIRLNTRAKISIVTYYKVIYKLWFPLLSVNLNQKLLNANNTIKR
jgi:hypothetical protein